MKKDFYIGQSNEIVKDGVVYDLHNSYDPLGLNINFDRTVQLKFQPNHEHGKECTSITLTFIDVDHLEISPKFGSLTIQDLDEMGYKNPNDRDDAWLLTEQQSSPKDHMFFRFTNDGFLRIHSNRAHLEVQSRMD